MTGIGAPFRAVPLILWLAIVAGASPALAQDEPPVDGPPAPVSPEVVSRDTQGRVTVRAVRLTEPLVVDGLLKDPIYSQVPAIGDFVQQEPHEGAPATDPTERSEEHTSELQSPCNLVCRLLL